MRFSEAITLRDVSVEIGPDGRSASMREDTEVFFNRYSMGLQSRLAAASDGLKGVVEGQIRSCDYGGQQRAVIDGREYLVQSAEDSGEFCRLTLAERLDDGR